MKTNIYIDSIYTDSYMLQGEAEPGAIEKRFPFFYFWIKDHYYQQSFANFSKTHWDFGDDPTPISKNFYLQQKLSSNIPDIVGLGLYLWNLDTLLENAKWFKEKNPNALIIAGGPSAESTEEFFKNNPYVDIVVIGPGTEIFRRLIDAYINKKSVYDVDGISYFFNNKVIKNKPLSRSEDPLLINYVNNFRDEVEKLLGEYLEKYKKVIFQTYAIQGCPYSCSFCEQGTVFWSKLTKRPLEYIFDEIDFLVNFKNITYEFVDANFGITNDYIEIIKYINKKNKNNNLCLKYPAMAKNNVDNVFEIIELMKNGKLITSGNYAHIALQDTNPEVLKLNGRPMSKEFQKIEKFKSFTKDQKYKLNKTDLIIGLPGQSFDTLSVTLYDLFENELLGHYPPNYYNVLPNTTLTSDKNKIFFKTTVTNIRSHKTSQSSLIDFDGVDYTKTQFKIKHLTESDTINAAEIVAADYMFILLSHVHGFLRWLDTPVNYLKNYYNLNKKDFIKSYTKFFNPVNWNKLPDSIRLDLFCLKKWFTAEDEYFSRRDNLDLGYLTVKTVPKYRFYANYHDMSDLFYNIFVDQLGHDDPTLKNIMTWQEYNTLYMNKKTIECVSYNYEDIANKTSDVYYLSRFVFKFDELDTYKIYNKIKNLEQIHHIPNISVFEVDATIQKPLSVSKLN